MNNELSDFAARLRNVISSGGHCFVNAPIKGSDEALPSMSDDSFCRFAIELFALQFAHNPAYRKICQARGLTPSVVEHWTQIPAVPTTAFKELELSCISPAERTAVFHSSGTTEQRPSRHFHCAESLRVYEASLWEWFLPNILPDLRFASCELRFGGNSALRTPHSGLFLTPPPAQAPHSSLVYMFETVRRKLGRAGVPASRCGFFGETRADGSWTLDFDAVLAALHSTLDSRLSTLLLGTAFSFVHLLDFLAERDLRFQLPIGSRVMETGGYKNRSRSMPKSELHALITEALGVPVENIICEYGMSELSSQAYDSVIGGERRVSGQGGAFRPSTLDPRLHLFPPWARMQIVSPETGREVADGETGLIRIFDLANVYSVMAIQTEDLGVRRRDGFELIGRAQLAEPRGCSLMMMEGSSLSRP